MADPTSTRIDLAFGMDCKASFECAGGKWSVRLLQRVDGRMTYQTPPIPTTLAAIEELEDTMRDAFRRQLFRHEIGPILFERVDEEVMVYLDASLRGRSDAGRFTGGLRSLVATAGR